MTTPSPRGRRPHLGRAAAAEAWGRGDSRSLIYTHTHNARCKMARTKRSAAREAEAMAEVDARIAAWEAWRDRCAGREFQARVLHWDRLCGEGFVEVDVDGAHHGMTAYACNLPGRRTWYPETACVHYAAGAAVTVRLEPHFGGPTFVLGVTPAEFDAEKWASLDTERLAFKCDIETGAVINGLMPGEVAP